MKSRILVRSNLALCGLFLSSLASTQPSEISRTEYGHPDFQGTYTYRTITPLNRPRELEHLEILTADQAAEWEEFELRRQNRDLIIDSVGGAGYPPGVISYNNFWYERGDSTIADRRTSLIYDPPNGRLPALNEKGLERARIRAENRRLSIGPEGRTLADRCLMSGGAGPPLVPGAYNNNVQIVQTKDHIMILSEMIHRARIIRFDDAHQTRHTKWDGDAIAHFDGDTLVINTRYFYYHDNGRGASAQMILEERIRRIDQSTLEYDFTIEDPLSWDRPWSAKFPLRVINDPVYEYACHEGNHGLVGILAGWRRYESLGMNGDGTPVEEN